MGYEAVIFDNDGVLLDLTSTATHLDGARAAFESVGVDSPADEDVEAMSIGVTVPQLESVCARYGVEPAQFWRARDREVSAAQRAAMRAGEKRPYDDVDALDAIDRPLGVVSSNQRATVEFAFDYFGLDRHFETVHAREPTVESLRRKKPEPYYIHRALEGVGVDEALYVGDSESDVVAAHRAGIDAAFVRRSHTETTTLAERPEHEVTGLSGVADVVDG